MTAVIWSAGIAKPSKAESKLCGVSSMSPTKTATAGRRRLPGASCTTGQSVARLNALQGALISFSGVEHARDMTKELKGSAAIKRIVPTSTEVR